MSTNETTRIAASAAPLLSHLTELRGRLIKILLVLAVGVVVSFIFADTIFNLLLIPYERASASTPSPLELIYTAPHEYLFTQIKLSLFGALVITFPYTAAQIYLFVAPGLYKKEKHTLLPFLVVSPVLFALGVMLVYFLIMPLVMRFFLAMQYIPTEATDAAITMLPRVSEYLSLTTTLMFAFGLCFQLPVLLTLLVRTGLVRTETLRRGRKYAIVLAFVAGALLTPPDIISQIGLALPTIVLYEISIFAARIIEKKHHA